MDFDSNQTSIDNNWAAITHWPSLWVSQTVQEMLAQFHKRAISFISVALGCSVTKTAHLQSGAAGTPPSTHTPGRRLATVQLRGQVFNNQRMPYEPEKHTHTWNPRQSESELTCPQPGALHTKGLSSPIFAKALQYNCGREDENITEGFFERLKPGKVLQPIPGMILPGSSLSAGSDGCLKITKNRAHAC